MESLSKQFPDWRPFLPARVARLQPYIPVESAPGMEGAVRLHANEMPWGKPWNRYPAFMPGSLRAALGKRFQLPAESVFTANGSDEIIDLLQRTFAESGKDEILVTSPSFSMYAHGAAVNGLGVQTAMLNDRFELDDSSAMALTHSNTRLAFFCDPNNPTGNRIGDQALRQFLQDFKGLVVLDEAYAEFAGVDHSAWLKEFPNLILLRTLSKAWGMAGIRLGYALAHPAVVESLDRVRMPYALSESTQGLALSALEKPLQMEGRVQRIMEARDELALALAALDGVDRVFPSEANFILLQVKSAVELVKRAERAGLLIRCFPSSPVLRNCVRVSIGTAQENRKMLQVFKKYSSDLTVSK